VKIGIFVHSQTGNTLEVAQRLEKRFRALGHTVSLERVTAAKDDETNPAAVVLTKAPALDGYDAVVFAGPVRGFQLSPVLQAYLMQVPSLRGVAVAGFVTQHFPKPWLGGNQAIRRMQALCRAKGREVTCTGVVNWVNPERRERLISETVEKISEITA